MSEERMLILRMLQEGKITAEQAAELLDAIEPPRSQAPPLSGLAGEIKRTVEEVVRTLPKEPLGDVTDVLRDSLREAAREWRHRGREPWVARLAVALGGGHEATAPFEEVRVTSATRLVVRNTRGTLRLTRSPDGLLHVKATRRVRTQDPHEAERLAMKLPIDIHEEGDTVTVEGPRARPFHERHRVEFDIAVPDALDVTVHLVRGDATAEGLSRPLAITTVKGDVRVTDCASIAVEGVSSDVDIQRPSGDIAVKIIRGDIAVGHASGDIAVTTKRGNITLRAHTVRRLDASTVRGDMTLMLERMAPGGTADMHTINGDVSVVLGPEVHCRLDATTVSGDISSRLPLQAASADACHVSGILGAPEATLRVRTTRGDIRLAQTTPSAAAPPA